jgi:hypothetical protein
MSITRYPPNTIWLGGEHATVVNDLVAKEVITPGMLIERVNDAGTPKFQKHGTAAVAGATYALDQSMLNKGVDDTYAVGDLVEALVCPAGTTVWALIASGQNIAAGVKLESAGNGTLRTLAAGIAIALAIEAANNAAGPSNMRIKVETL